MSGSAKPGRARSRPPAGTSKKRAGPAPADEAGKSGLPAEAEAILDAIRSNQVDALVLGQGESEKVFALRSIEELTLADTELKNSDRVRLEFERRFDTLAAHAPVGIFINDFSGNCLYVNQRGCEIAGLTPAQALGQGLLNAVHPGDRERLKRERTQATAAGIPFESEYRYCLPGGKVVWVARKSSPLVGQGGKPVARIGTIIDITERKLAEEALRESRERLRELLEERERLTQDLHDGCIQSLYAIGLNLQSSRQKLEGNSEAARVIAGATANLNLVIQELRAFIGAQSAGGTVKPDLAREIERAGQVARDQGLAFDLSIDSKLADAMSADKASHVLQIAREAISNATRHASAKTLRVQLQMLNDSICLEIRDDGIGFNPHAGQKSGLGLHNIEARARALRGQARILSTPGNGTRILVQVPVAR